MNLLEELVLVELRVSRFKIKVRIKLKGSGLAVRDDNLTSVAIPGSAIACRETVKQQGIPSSQNQTNPLKKNKNPPQKHTPCSCQTIKLKNSLMFQKVLPESNFVGFDTIHIPFIINPKVHSLFKLLIIWEIPCLLLCGGLFSSLA